MKYDVGIIGIGTVGSMAAWQLASQGLSVIGFEQFGIGHDRSGAGGESRLFRTAYKEGPQYVPLLLEAKKLWRRLEDESGTNLLTIIGGLTIGNQDDEVIKNVTKSVLDFQLKYEFLDAKQAAARYPQHRLQKEDVMIFDYNAGVIRPELAVVAAASRAQELGAEIHSYCKVEDFDKVGDTFTITADGKKYEVEKLLLTAGPWLGNMLPALKPIVTAKKVMLTWFPAKDIKQFQPDRFPVFTRISAGTRLFGAPTLENSMVKVGISNALEDVAEPDNLNRTIELEELEYSRELIGKFFNGLRSDPIRASAYMDCYTIDDHSIIDELPDMPNAYVFGGFSGHGFKMAPAIGKLAADILTGQENGFDSSHLAFNRFSVIGH